MSRKKRVVDIPDEALIPKDPVPWCEAGEGVLRCLVCGSSIRVGGEAVVGGEVKRRAFAPFKWFAKHSEECGRNHET